jgi:hypothetical protein
MSDTPISHEEIWVAYRDGAITDTERERLLGNWSLYRYQSAATAAASKNVSPTRIQKLCRENRIPGAYFEGGQWFVPRGFVILPASRDRPGKLKKV